VYLTNDENYINFSFNQLYINNYLSLNTEIIFSTIDLSFIKKLFLKDLLNNNNISNNDNLFEFINIKTIDDSLHFNMKLKPFASNLLIHFKHRSKYNTEIFIINNSENSLHLRNINNDIIISNKNDLQMIEHNGFKHLFSKPTFHSLYDNLPKFQSDEERKIYMIDTYINEYI
jgi:hypothetical protein